jgi:hypothetical protein
MMTVTISVRSQPPPAACRSGAYEGLFAFSQQ